MGKRSSDLFKGVHNTSFISQDAEESNKEVLNYDMSSIIDRYLTNNPKCPDRNALSAICGSLYKSKMSKYLSFVIEYGDDLSKAYEEAVSGFTHYPDNLENDPQALMIATFCSSFLTGFKPDETVCRQMNMILDLEERGMPVNDLYVSFSALGRLVDFEKWHDRQFGSPLPAEAITKTGCYIATAVYGSYDCPQIRVLRRYRDDVLAGSWYGRLFIRSYYAISPSIVRWFGRKAWFRNFWIVKLDKFADKFKRSGYADAPHTD